MGKLDMTDHDAFMQTIIENPDDDTPRLIFADWLEEHGQEELAEFIQVQCELWKLRQGPAGPVSEDSPWLQSDLRYHALRRREWELFSADDVQTLRWFGLPQPWSRIVRLETFDKDDPDYPYAVVRRGFIAEVTLPCADWLKHREQLLKTAPLERVTLTHLPYYGDGPEDRVKTYVLRRGQRLIWCGPAGNVNLSFPNPGQTAESMLPKTGIIRIPSELLHPH